MTPEPKQGEWLASPWTLFRKSDVLAPESLLALAIAVTLIAAASLAGAWIGFITFLALWVLLLVYAIWRQNQHGRGQDLALEDSDDASEAFVQIVLSRGGISYAKDFGVLYLEGDLIRFQSDRCYFALGRGDLQNDWNAENTYFQCAYSIVRKEPGYGIIIIPAKHPRDPKGRRAKALIDRIYNLVPAELPDDAERVYPPIEHWRKAYRRLQKIKQLEAKQ